MAGDRLADAELLDCAYEYFSPYSEKYDRLSTLDTGNNFASVATVLSNGVGPYSGKYPRDLVYPEHDNFSPRIGFAVRAFKDTVVRGGYGINYAVGQYVKFVQDFAFEPPYADVQTNEATAGVAISSRERLPHAANGRQLLGQQVLSAALCPSLEPEHTAHDPRRHRAQLRLQRGSKGTRLDIVDAPGRTATASLSGVLYDYEDSASPSPTTTLSP